MAKNGRAVKDYGKKFRSRLASSFIGIVHYDLLTAVPAVPALPSAPGCPLFPFGPGLPSEPSGPGRPGGPCKVNSESFLSEPKIK